MPVSANTAGCRWPRLLALLLASLALAPAQADLKLESQHLRAWVQLAEPDMVLSGPSETVWALGQPPGPVTVVKAARGASLAAAARQTPDGFFHAAAALDQGWDDLPGAHWVGAGTQFESLITTNQPDTPLLLDFLFLGSRLEAGAYYGIGNLQASVRLGIRAGIGHSARTGVQLYWGFEDRLERVAGGVIQAQHVSATDRTGIGLPAVQTSSGWQNMVSQGRLERGAYRATLDFGLLQPGEFFALDYSAEVRLQSDTPYASSARAEVIDPFGLRDDPPLQLSLRGLALPAAVGVVPEPATPALLLAGLAGLLALYQRRPLRRLLQRHAGGLAALALAATLPAAQATTLDYPAPFGNFYGDQPGVLDVQHHITHLGSAIDGLSWWAGGYDELLGVAWSPYSAAGTLAHVDLRVLDGQPLRLDGFRLGSWAGAAGRQETVSVTPIGAAAPVWQFTGLIGVDNRANGFELGLQSTTGFTITWTNPWWTAIDDIRFQTAAVPEPGTWALWLLGLGGLAQRRVGRRLWGWRAAGSALASVACKPLTPRRTCNCWAPRAAATAPMNAC